MTRSSSKQTRKTRSNASQTTMATYAAATKQSKKQQNAQTEKEKQALKKKKIFELSESEEEEEESEDNEDDDTTSNTSKKREREEILVRKVTRKAEKDNSMEIDEDDIAIVGVTPGVAKKPNLKNTTTQAFEATLPEVWKLVDSKSRNRRKFNPTERDSTPDRANRSGRSFPNQTRITLKLQVEAGERPQQEVLKSIKRFAKEIFQADKTAAILPWKNEEQQKKVIKKANDLPDNAYELRDYLSECWSPKPGEKKTVYPHIYLGHSDSLEDIRKNMGDFLSFTSQAIYQKMLQVDESCLVGFLVYSHNDMDAGALADEISDQIKIPVGLRWRTIDIGIKGAIPDNQKVSALHIEIEKKHKLRGMKKLFELYPRKLQATHTYPNGIKMRFVKNKSDAINIPEKRKIDKLRARQEKFSKKIRKIENWDILMLDTPASEGMTPSLRQMIMSIPSKVQPGTSLFHAVDLNWRGSGYNYLVAPALLEEAQCIVPHILCVIKELFPGNYYNYATTCVTMEALELSETLKYDLESGNIYDELDENEVEIDDEFDLLGFDTGKEQQEDAAVGPNSRPRANQNSFMPDDDDSISTFGGNQGGSFVRGFNPSHHQRQSAATNETSSTSTLTLSTHDPHEDMDKAQKELAEIKRLYQLEKSKNAQLIDSISNLPSQGSYPNSFAKIGSSANDKSQGGSTIEVTPAKGLQ